MGNFVVFKPLTRVMFPSMQHAILSIQMREKRLGLSQAQRVGVCFCETSPGATIVATPMNCKSISVFPR